MTTVVSINGLIVDPTTAAVSVFDRGVLLGDSVFETLRTYQGRPDAVDEHLARLRSSADQVGIELPVSAAQLRGEIFEAVSASGNAESTIRLTITRGQGGVGLDPTGAREPTRWIIVRALPRPHAGLYRDGLAVATVAVPSPSPLIAGAKSGSYLLNVLAVRAARQQGAADALLVTSDGRVLEAASSNVFVVEGAAIATPPLTAGILPGITRERVITLAGRLGLGLQERDVTLADLWTADEVFLTSSIRELVPVVRIDEHEVGSGRPGETTRRLHAAYLDAVGALPPRPWDALA